MGIVGFKDAEGTNVPFQDIIEGAGRFLPGLRPIILAMARDEHARSAARQEEGLDLSVTELTVPMRIAMLSRRYDVFVDPLRLLDAWEGNTMHARLAAVEGGQREMLLSVDVDGVRFGGHLDRYHEGVITDWKWTKVYACQRVVSQGIAKAQFHWYIQLNCYRWLLMQNGEQVTGMRIIMRLKDWSATSWKKSSGNYPESPLVIVEAPVKDDIQQYVHDAVAQYKRYRDAPDTELPMCTDEDTWQGKRCEHYCDYSQFCKATMFDWQAAMEATIALFADSQAGSAWLMSACPDGLPTDRASWLMLYRKAKKEERK